VAAAPSWLAQATALGAAPSGQAQPVTVYLAQPRGGGGTSVSSPLFAGLEALADQAAGRPHGFVNPLLYRLRGTGILRDIVNARVPVALAVSQGGTSYLDTLQDDTSLRAVPGYDGQTGLGSPDGAVYVAALSRVRG
jgi:hypothetical protein